MTTTTILLAHTFEIYCTGLETGLHATNLQLSKKTQNGQEALAYILNHKPDLAILELKIADFSAFDIIRKTREEGVETKFFILLPTPNQLHLVLLNPIKISGCVYAGESQEHIVTCITQVLKGQVCFSKSLNILIEEDKALRHLELLSPTEINVLSLIPPFKSSVKIAKQLSNSVRTIEKHRSNIIAKLKLEKNPYSLTNWAIEHQEVIKQYHVVL